MSRRKVKRTSKRKVKRTSKRKVKRTSKRNTYRKQKKGKGKRSRYIYGGKPHSPGNLGEWNQAADNARAQVERSGDTRLRNLENTCRPAAGSDRLSSDEMTQSSHDWFLRQTEFCWGLQEENERLREQLGEVISAWPTAYTMAI
jgi:hypothetical protein